MGENRIPTKMLNFRPETRRRVENQENIERPSTSLKWHVVNNHDFEKFVSRKTYQIL